MWRFIFVTFIFTSTLARPEYYKENEDFKYSRSSTDEGSKSGFYEAQRGNVGGNYERAHNMDIKAQDQLSTVSKHIEDQLGHTANAKTGSIFTSGTSQGEVGSQNYGLQSHNLQTEGNHGSLLNAQGNSYSGSSSYSSGYNSESSKHSGYQTYGTDHSLQSGSVQGIGLTGSYGKDGSFGSSGYQSQIDSKSVSKTPIKVVLRPGSTVNVPIYAQSVDASHGASYGQGNLQGVGISDAHDYRSESGYQSHSGHQSQNGYQSNLQTQSTGKAPIKVILRPGSTVHVPIYAQTVDASQSTSFDQNNLNSGNNLLVNSGVPKVYNNQESYNYRKEWERHNTNPETAATLVVPTPYNQNHIHGSQSLLSDSQSTYNKHLFDQNNFNSENHLLVNSGVPKVYNNQESYNYRKEWERHNTNPETAATLVVPTPYNQNHIHGSQSLLSNSQSTNNKHLLNQNQYQSNSNSFSQRNLNSNIQEGSLIDIAKPKNYQSSYSYHKSWEKQGDPYVIQPGYGQLSTGSQNSLASSNQYGSHYQQHLGQVRTQGNGLDCDNDQQTRVKRSHISDEQQQTQDWDQSTDLTQQARNKWDNLEDLSQQTQTSHWNINRGTSMNKPEKLEDFDQQSQSAWEHTGNLNQQKENNNRNIYSQQQLTQQSQKLEDFSQLSQSSWEKTPDLSQQSLTQQSFHKRELNEQLIQQTENQWGSPGINHKQNPSTDFSQQFQNSGRSMDSKLGHIHQVQDLGQESLNPWNTNENFQQNKHEKLEDFGQQLQSSWDLSDLGQQESKWDHSGQQSQLASSLTQHKHEYNQGILDDFGQQTQNVNGQTMDSSLQFQELGHHQQVQNLGQQSLNTRNTNENLQQNKHEKLEDFGQQLQSSSDLSDLGQQESKWDHSGQQSQLASSLTQHKHEYNQGILEDFGQQTQNVNGQTMDSRQQTQELGHHQQVQDLGQQSLNTWNTNENLQQNKHEKLEDFGQQLQSSWDLSDLGQQESKWDHSGQQSQLASSLTQHTHEYNQGILEDFGQQTQNVNGQTMDSRQQTQELGHHQQVQDLGQQSLNTWNTNENLQQNKHEKLEDFGQQLQSSWDLTDLGQQESKWDHSGQQSQLASSLTQHKHEYNQGKLEEFGQQTQNINGQPIDSSQQIQQLGQHIRKNEEFGQHTQSAWDLTELGQQTQNSWDNIGSMTQTQQKPTGLHPHNKWDTLETQNIKPEQNPNLQSGQSIWSNSADNTGAQSVWDKFDQVNQETTGMKDSDHVNKLWGNVDQSQFTLHNNDFNANNYSHHVSSQNSYQSTTFLGGSPHGPLQGETFNSGYSTSWHPIFTTKPETTTVTATQKSETATFIRPQDIGRGDIGAEDLMTHVTTITEKENPKKHTIFNRPYKTPEQIEALSLTKEENQFAGVINMNSDQESLSVIGLDQQKRTNELKEHNSQQYHTNHQVSELTTPRTTIKINPEAHISNKYHSNHDRELSVDQQQQSQTSWGDLGQQVQTPWDNQKDSLQHDDTKQIQDFHQPILDSVQSQETQKLEDFGQSRNHEQTQDQQNQGVQSQNTQQIQDFGQLQKSEQSQDFYNQKFGDVQIKDTQQSTSQPIQQDKHDSIQVSQKLEDLQSGSQQATVVEVTTSEKTGFWQSVGNKFSSAKDKVSSWFHKS